MNPSMGAASQQVCPNSRVDPTYVCSVESTASPTPSMVSGTGEPLQQSAAEGPGRTGTTDQEQVSVESTAQTTTSKAQAGGGSASGGALQPHALAGAAGSPRSAVRAGSAGEEEMPKWFQRMDEHKGGTSRFSSSTRPPREQAPSTGESLPSSSVHWSDVICCHRRRQW